MHNDPSYEQVQREERLRASSRTDSYAVTAVYDFFTEREDRLKSALTYCYKLLSKYDITDENGNKIVSDEMLGKILKVIKDEK